MLSKIRNLKLFPLKKNKHGTDGLVGLEIGVFQDSYGGGIVYLHIWPIRKDRINQNP
jgi:hypothetical protein